MIFIYRILVLVRDGTVHLLFFLSQDLRYSHVGAHCFPTLNIL